MSLIRRPEDAEETAAAWLRTVGFADAAVTGPGADGGVDVVATGLVAQVKAEMKPVGRPVVQQIAGVGSVGGHRAAVFSLAGFTPEAEAWASQAGVALFGFDLQGDVEPMNEAAAAIARSQRVLDSRPQDATVSELGRSLELLAKARTERTAMFLLSPHKIGSQDWLNELGSNSELDELIADAASLAWSLLEALDIREIFYGLSESETKALASEAPSVRPVTWPEAVAAEERLGVYPISAVDSTDVALLARQSTMPEQDVIRTVLSEGHTLIL
jgi:hypothetical protein